MSANTLCLELTVENVVTKDDLEAYADEILKAESPRKPTPNHEQIRMLTSIATDTLKMAIGTGCNVGVEVNEQSNFDIHIREIPSKFDSIRDLLLDRLIKVIEALGFPVLQYTEVV